MVSCSGTKHLILLGSLSFQEYEKAEGRGGLGLPFIPSTNTLKLAITLAVAASWPPGSNATLPYLQCMLKR